MKVEPTSRVVEAVLEQSKLSRNNNNILYSMVCKKVNPAIAESNLRFHDVFENAEVLGLPSYETVVRSRRKIVEKRPELQGHNALEGRKEKELEIIEYAKL